MKISESTLKELEEFEKREMERLYPVMEQMKEVTRYQCQYCKKDFRTPNQHYCKFNPILKNCFTCKHLKGWVEGEKDYHHGYWNPNYPDCNVNKGDHRDIEQIKDNKYDMQCESWEEGEYNWAKENE